MNSFLFDMNHVNYVYFIIYKIIQLFEIPGLNIIIYYICWLLIIADYFLRHFQSFDCELILCENIVQPAFSALGIFIGKFSYSFLKLGFPEPCCYCEIKPQICMKCSYKFPGRIFFSDSQYSKQHKNFVVISLWSYVDIYLVWPFLEGVVLYGRQTCCGSLDLPYSHRTKILPPVLAGVLKLASRLQRLTTLPLRQAWYQLTYSLPGF